jgi:NodT family efflux transporter outer membrane factor (OMF) lipoprotein
MQTEGWLTTLGDAYLNGLVSEALKNNHTVKAQSAVVQQAEQQRIISGAPRLPTLDASISGARRKGQVSGIETTSSSFSASLDLSWEIDIWGKLSATQKQASLNLAAQQARLQRVRQQLVADVCNAWFDVIEAQNLLSLFEHRLKNLNGNLAIIEDGYNKGINTALDVFLARNNVEQESARTEAQRLSLAGARQNLLLLLGRYPDAGAFPARDLPLIDTNVPAGLPSTLLDRRPDIRSSWLELMASDAGVAIAHRQRFPSLSLTGSIGQSSTALKDLLGGDHSVWSLSGSLLQPLFNSGALAAREAQARGELKQKEQQYLDNILQAFAEVESALIGEQNLRAQYQRSVAAERSALAAEELSFEQYQRGLVTYTTVLEAERRAVDAQSNVVQLKRRRLRNRIDLYLALGGNFSDTNGEQQR